MATSKNFVEHKNEGIRQHFLREKHGQSADVKADKKYSICNLDWANRPMLIIFLLQLPVPATAENGNSQEYEMQIPEFPGIKNTSGNGFPNWKVCSEALQSVLKQYLACRIY